MKYSWDTKVTTDVAALGGLGPLLGTVLNRNYPAARERFDTMLDRLHTPYYSQLNGESNPYAFPPSIDERNNETVPASDFPVCQILDAVVPPPLTENTIADSDGASKKSTNSATSSSRLSLTGTLLLLLPSIALFVFCASYS